MSHVPLLLKNTGINKILEHRRDIQENNTYTKVKQPAHTYLEASQQAEPARFHSAAGRSGS